LRAIAYVFSFARQTGEDKARARAAWRPEKIVDRRSAWKRQLNAFASAVIGVPGKA